MNGTKGRNDCSAERRKVGTLEFGISNFLIWATLGGGWAGEREAKWLYRTNVNVLIQYLVQKNVGGSSLHLFVCIFLSIVIQFPLS